MISLEEGEFLLRLARQTMEVYLLKQERLEVPDDTPAKLREKGGIFVTLDTHPKRELRGCIGHPYPDFPLVESAIDSAISAATKDPRFPPVKFDELAELVIEISVLAPPEQLQVQTPQEYTALFEIGRHGLMVEKGYFMRGLLLPQVAVEYGWDKQEFLSQTCWKAGLPPDSWLDPILKVYRFEGQVFAEEDPKGAVKERELIKEAQERIKK